MKRTVAKRHDAMLRLAAYIFNCDGMALSESKMLELLLDHMTVPMEKREKEFEKLMKFNSGMPYETFRKYISCLFVSKKTLCLAWQCMAVDKQITETEKRFFERLVSEYDLKRGELDSLKQFAESFSTLSEEEIISEYLDCKPVKAIDRRVYYICKAMVWLPFIGLIIEGLCFITDGVMGLLLLVFAALLFWVGNRCLRIKSASDEDLEKFRKEKQKFLSIQSAKQTLLAVAEEVKASPLV